MTFYKRQDSFKDTGQVFKYLSEEHKKFCESDDPEEKEEALRLLKGYAKTYLNCTPQNSKFETEQVGRVLTQTIQQRKESFEPREASEAFEHLAKYTQCLLEQPWRKEFKTMFLYSGYYIHNVQAHLDNAHEVLVAMGFTHIDHETLKLAGPPDLARLRDVSRSCFLASQECEILEQIADFVKSKTRVEVQPAQVYHYRCNHMGDVTTIGTRMCYDINQREHELKTAKLSRSTGHLRPYDTTPEDGAEITGEICHVPERELVEKVLFNTEHSNKHENIYDPVCTENFKTASHSLAHEFKVPADYGRAQSSGHPNHRKSERSSEKSVESYNNSGERADKYRRNSGSSSASGGSAVVDKHQPLNKGKVPRESVGLALAANSSVVSKLGESSRKSYMRAEGDIGVRNQTSVDDIVAEAGSYKFNFPATLNTSSDQPRLFSTSAPRNEEDVERKSSVSSDTSSWDYRDNGNLSKTNLGVHNTQSNVHSYFRDSDEAQVVTGRLNAKLNTSSIFEDSVDGDNFSAANAGNVNLSINDDEKRTIKTKEILTQDGMHMTQSNMKKITNDPGIRTKGNSHQTRGEEVEDATSLLPWKCPHCTYMNHCEGKICQICSKSKDFQFEPEVEALEASFATLAIPPKLANKSYATAVDSTVSADNNVLRLRSDTLPETSVKTIECVSCTLQNLSHRQCCEVCGTRLKQFPE